VSRVVKKIAQLRTAGLLHLGAEVEGGLDRGLGRQNAMQYSALLRSEMRLVSRVSPVQTALRNCTRDEGRSFEVGNQVLTRVRRARGGLPRPRKSCLRCAVLPSILQDVCGRFLDHCGPGRPIRLDIGPRARLRLEVLLSAVIRLRLIEIANSQKPERLPAIDDE